MADNESVLEELADKHRGRVEGFETPEGDLIAIAPPPNAHLAYTQYFDTLADRDSGKLGANLTLVLACVVHPEREKARALLKRYPAMILPIAREAETLLGGSVKKLGKAQKTPNETT